MESVIYVETDDGIIKNSSENLKKLFGEDIIGKKFDDIFFAIDGTIYEAIINTKRFYFKISKFENRYILCDITKEFKTNKILNLLQSSADVLINSKNEEEIFTKLIDNLSNYTSFSCFLRKKENFLKFKICSKDLEEKVKEKIESYLSLDNKKCPLINSFLNNEILLIKNVETNDLLSKEAKENFKKASINYMCAIPISKKNSTFGLILITSRYKDEFLKEIFYFDKLKKLIEFTLEKLDIFSSLALIKNAIDKEYSWIVITDENANIIYANEAVLNISGYELDELIGKNPRIFKSGVQSKKFYENLWQKLINQETFEGIFINRKKNGELFYLKDKIIPVTTPDGKKYYISIATDISNEYKLKRRLTKIKYNDTLTGLLNREGFIEKLSIALNPEDKYAILVIDIKDFKIINQLFSREVGDDFLLKIANTLKEMFPDSLIARVGADDFAVCIKYEDESKLYKIIEKILNIFKKINLSGIDLSINIGVALFPKDDIDASGLLEKAFIALEHAKKKGEFEFDFYDHDIYEKLIRYQHGKVIISDALRYDKFVYYLQPYINSKTGKIAGAESLLRVEYDNKLIPPSEFIDYAEKSGKIKEIEKKMFPKFIEMVKELNIPISFNISGKSLNDKNHIFNLFKNVNNLPILIELTEREIALNLEYTKKLLEFFKAKKLKISIDDFGTGYSSLTYLKHIPADFLKIDMSFVKNIENSPKDLAIVETIINFAHKLGMKTIAEGVETKNQVEILKKLGCDCLQGFYFYKPMPYEEFKKLVRQSLEGGMG